MNPTWRIELFGGLRALSDHGTVEHFHTVRTAALVVRLALMPSVLHTRGDLATLLWPDADGEASRNNLRVSIAALRRIFEPEGVAAGSVVRADRLAVRFAPGSVVTDALEFESLLERERNCSDDIEGRMLLETAIHLYRGPLAPLMTDDWIVEARDRYTDLWIGAHRRLSRRLVALRDFDAAVDVARRAVASDPLRESAHRDLMRIYSAAGRPADAQRQYRELERVLREEMNVAPSPVTADLAIRLGGARPAIPSPPGGVPAVQPLPRPVGQFFGRAAEFEAVRDEVASAGGGGRIVTITGSGGCGKTRLALEVARAAAPAFGDRVWFADLSAVTSAAGVAPAIAAALGIDLETSAEPMARIAESIGDTKSLLVLDNVPPLGQAIADMAQALSANCPALAILATSHRALGCRSESVHQLTPLEVEAVDALGEDPPAVSLFIARAVKAGAAPEALEADAETIRELCRRLEGLPLAIEIAAAWAGIISPSQMLERMDARFDLLVKPGAAADDPRSSLQAAIGASVHMLSDEVRKRFARLSVFRGGWTLEAADALVPEGDMAPALFELRQSSLIGPSPDAPDRFTLLDAVREFADDLLVPSERTDALDAHAAYYARFVTSRMPRAGTAKFREACDRLSRDHANVRQAVLRLAARGQPHAAGAMCAVLRPYWYLRGHGEEAIDILREVASAFREAHEAVAPAVAFAAGVFAAATGNDDEAVGWFDACAPLESLAGTGIDPAAVLLYRYEVAGRRADAAGMREAARQMVAFRRASGDRWELATALGRLAFAAGRMGDTKSAAAAAKEELALRTAMGDRWGAASAANTDPAAVDPLAAIAANFLALGTHAVEQGDLVAAGPLFQEALAMYRDLGDLAGEALALLRIADLAQAVADCAAARAALSSAAVLLRRRGDSGGLAEVLARASSCAEAKRDVAALKAYTAEFDALSPDEKRRAAPLAQRCCAVDPAP